MRRWGSCGKFPPLVYGLFILSGRRPPATSPGPSKKKRNGRSKNKPVNYRLEACQQIDGSTPGCLQKCTTSYFSKNFFAFFFFSLWTNLSSVIFFFGPKAEKEREEGRCFSSPRNRLGKRRGTAAIGRRICGGEALRERVALQELRT